MGPTGPTGPSGPSGERSCAHMGPCGASRVCLHKSLGGPHCWSRMGPYGPAAHNMGTCGSNMRYAFHGAPFGPMWLHKCKHGACEHVGPCCGPIRYGPMLGISCAVLGAMIKFVVVESVQTSRGLVGGHSLGLVAAPGLCVLKTWHG